MLRFTSMIFVIAVGELFLAMAYPHRSILVDIVFGGTTGLLWDPLWKRMIG